MISKKNVLFCSIKITLHPIILVPGTGASQLTYTDKQTGKQGLCWIPHNVFNMFGICQNYLFCRYNKQTKQVESYCKEYADIKPMEGKNGCGVTLQLGDLKIVKYFCDLIQFLELNGYVYGKNLFAMSYDWRQDIAQVAMELKKIVRYASKINKQKVCILGHSLGNQVCDIYLRLDPNFNKYVYRYFAVAPPFDGTSAVVPMSYVKGYDMSQPLPLSVCKQIEIQSAMMAYLGNKPNGSEKEFPCIFIKKRDYVPEDFKEQQDLIELQKQNLIKADYKNIILNKGIYKGKMPDLAFLIAEDIYNKRALKKQYIYYDFKFLQQMCKRGAISFDFEKDNHVIQHDLYMHLERAEKPQIKITDPKIKWHWEIYYPNINKPYTGKKWWTNEQIKGDYIDLNNKMHSQGTFYGYLYNCDRALQQKAIETKAIPINFQKDSEFRVYSYIGVGVKTKMHVYYDQVINYYEEILDLKPKYTHADGDGTVLKTAAENDGYPDWVIERTFRKVKGHNDMLFQKSFFQWLWDKL